MSKTTKSKTKSLVAKKSVTRRKSQAQTTKSPTKRSAARATRPVRKRASAAAQTYNQPDGIFFLKLVLYFVMGTFWLRLVNADITFQIPIPVGLLLGLVLASHDRFNIDRKIEYAILLMATFIGFWFQGGLYWFVL